MRLIFVLRVQVETSGLRLARRGFLVALGRQRQVLDRSHFRHTITWLST